MKTWVHLWVQWPGPKRVSWSYDTSRKFGEYSRSKRLAGGAEESNLSSSFFWVLSKLSAYIIDPVHKWRLILNKNTSTSFMSMVLSGNISTRLRMYDLLLWPMKDIYLCIGPRTTRGCHTVGPSFFFASFLSSTTERECRAVVAKEMSPLFCSLWEMRFHWRFVNQWYRPGR